MPALTLSQSLARPQKVGLQARRTRAAPTRALALPELLQLAAVAPGTVDAPIGAVIGGAVVVTAGALLLTVALKPGIEASEKMQERDR